jgi:hypothetical protein
MRKAILVGEHWVGRLTRAAEQAAQVASATLASIRKPILEAAPLAIDEHSLQELHERDAAAATAARAVPAAILVRRQAITAALESGTWPSIAVVDEKQIQIVESAVAAMRTEAERVEKLADPAAQAALEAERVALAGRIEIGKRKERIDDVVTKFRDAARLATCHAKINTTAITSKGKELATELLTKDLV